MAVLFIIILINQLEIIDINLINLNNNESNWTKHYLSSSPGGG